jgi:RNA polymerase sigma-70 factor, ECF subfamily
MTTPADPSRIGRPWLRSVGLPSLDQLEDEDLVRRVARGDTAAFEVVYQRHASRVLGVARRVVRNPAQSEEVAQEVLVEVWSTAARFDPAQGSFRAWVTTMARRRAIDRVRSVQAADDRDLRAAASSHSPDFDQVSETVELRLEAERVRHCLGGLTDLQRESIELAFFGGYSHREVSDVLDLPLGTIKTRLRDGLIRLRDCMGVA